MKNEKLNQLNIDFNIPINQFNIELLSKVFKNLIIREKIKTPNYVNYEINITNDFDITKIFVNLYQNNKVKNVLFNLKTQRKNPRKINSFLKYHTINDLLYDIKRLDIELLISDEYENIITDKKYYNEISKYNGFHISKIVNGKSNILINRKIVLILNHKLKIIEFPTKNNFEINELHKISLSSYYNNIVNSLNDYNYSLNHLRNDLYLSNLPLENKNELNKIILNFQYLFNEY